MNYYRTSRSILFIGFVLLFSKISLAQYADPSITGGVFVSDFTTIGSESELNISFVNSGFSAIPEGSIELTISTPLYYSSDGYNPPTGEGADFFDWVYIQDDVWRGTNNAIIPSFEGGEVKLNVMGLIVSPDFESTNINVQPVNNFNSFADETGNNNLQPGLKINDSALPVEWSHFSVFNKETYHHLNWETLIEINVSHYIIQRRLTSLSNQFTDLKRVESLNGNFVGKQNYTYDDYEISLSGTYYYRIKQVDNDGSISYSEIKSIHRNKEYLDFKVFPNPTTSFISIQGKFESEMVKCHILDTEGRTVKLLNASSKSNLIEVNMEDLHAGIYHILVYNDELIGKFKVIKL